MSTGDRPARGTRALVTGATAGIGREFARQLAAAGHDLVLVARDTERLTAVADELSGRHGVRVDVMTADLTVPADLDAVADVLRDVDRPVDLLVNNAGASLKDWFGTTDIADEDRQLDLLVRAPLHLMDAALTSMRGRGRGAIVNVASVAAFTPRGTYSASKAYLVNLSQWADAHYAAQGVRVMALCPGFVRTEFHQRGDMDTSGVRPWMWLQADKVVSEALADLRRGRTVSIPSLRYTVIAALARHAPSRIVTRLARRGR